VGITLTKKRHRLLRFDYADVFEWFKNNGGNSVANKFKLAYIRTIDELENYPYHSHPLSMFRFFEELLDDDNFRYLRLGTRTSYYLFNYISGKNYILACMSINLEGNTLADKLQFREQTKEIM
jgi:hypothetical protein